ncbi:bifunctional [glutamine synthetase] adenylyltransferase/[glutamine synthetase]-adenylyl-L-tyrosine phosphorylase, partial [Micromonospora sp. NPDC003944]
MSRPTRAPGRLARYGFGTADGDGGARAADLLGPAGLGLWRPVEQEPVDEAAAELLAALSRAADPDLALRQLHRIVEAEGRATDGSAGGRATDGSAGGRATDGSAGGRATDGSAGG